MSIAQLESHPSAYGILDFIAGRFYNSQHVCVLGTQVVANAVLKNRRIERFVHISTSEVYGTARSVPIREEHKRTSTKRGWSS